MSGEALRERILMHARGLGFDRVGIARADDPLAEAHDRYLAFIDAGMHGGMEYLARNSEVRRTLCAPSILEGARTVLCVAQRCAVIDEHVPGQGLTKYIARYARGLDYHNHVRRNLRRLASFINQAVDGTLSRAMIDTAPVLERAWAERAGVGFIGKNGMLIVPGLGSHVVLGEVATTLELRPDVPLRPRCGACRRCLEACPTGALVRPHVLDARLCISYLTIEHRGDYDDWLKPMVGPRVFGCDVCQDVCPFNATKRARIEPGTPFDPLERWSHVELGELMELDAESHGKLFEGSPLRRVRPADWARNASVVSANLRALEGTWL